MTRKKQKDQVAKLEAAVEAQHPPAPVFDRPPYAREDLEWFFGACEKEMGLSSSFGPMVSRLKGLSGGTRTSHVRAPTPDTEGAQNYTCGDFVNPIEVDPYTDAVVKATTKHKKIRRALAKLPHGVYGFLAAFYACDARPSSPASFARLHELLERVPHDGESKIERSDAMSEAANKAHALYVEALGGVS